MQWLHVTSKISLVLAYSPHRHMIIIIIIINIFYMCICKITEYILQMVCMDVCGCVSVWCVVGNLSNASPSQPWAAGGIACMLLIIITLSLLLFIQANNDDNNSWYNNINYSNNGGCWLSLARFLYYFIWARSKGYATTPTWLSSQCWNVAQWIAKGKKWNKIGSNECNLEFC